MATNCSALDSISSGQTKKVLLTAAADLRLAAALGT
jgi:hypothetical protein